MSQGCRQRKSPSRPQANKLLPTPGSVLCFMVTQKIMQNAKWKREADDNALRIVKATLRPNPEKLLERFLCCLETQAPKGVQATDRGNRFLANPCRRDNLRVRI
jgi:hypothetical protein